MVAHSDSVESATCQIWYDAAGCSGAAAEKSQVFIHNGGGVGVQRGGAEPRYHSLIGITI